MEKFSLSPNDDYDFFVGGEIYPIPVKASYPDSLVDSIAAAVVCQVTGLASVDYARKKHTNNCEREFVDHDAPVKDLLGFSDNYLEVAFAGFGDRSRCSIGEVAGDLALGRMKATLQTLLGVARRGFYFETLALARFAFEQLAWINEAYCVLSEEDLFQIKIGMAVTKLKSLYPKSGKIYGHLSSHVHFHADHHFKYIIDNEGDAGVLIKSELYKKHSLAWVFILVDILGAVFDAHYFHRINKTDFLVTQTKFNENRRTVVDFKNFFDGYYDDYVSEVSGFFA